MEKIDQALELWACYQYVCEEFDRTICTGPSKQGYVMPGSHEEMTRITNYARMAVRHVNWICRNDGIEIDTATKESVDRLSFQSVAQLAERSSFLSRLRQLMQLETDISPAYHLGNYAQS